MSEHDAEVDYSAYDAYGEDSPAPRSSSKKKKRNGPKKPVSWVPLDEDGFLLEMTEEQVKKLRARSLKLCLWHLERGDKAAGDLRKIMSKKSIPEDMQAEVIGELESYKYIDDERFAQNWVRTRHEYQGKAGMVLRMELRRKGVEDHVIDEAMDQISPEDERDAARKIVDKKLRVTRGMDSRKRSARLVAMLARKGYSASISYSVVREAIQDDELANVDTSELD